MRIQPVFSSVLRKPQVKQQRAQVAQQPQSFESSSLKKAGKKFKPAALVTLATLCIAADCNSGGGGPLSVTFHKTKFNPLNQAYVVTDWLNEAPIIKS